MATQITYDDKVQGVVNPAPETQKMTFQNANEIKTAVNTNATELDSTTTTANTALTNAATAQAAADAAQTTANNALPLAGGTMTGAILGDQSARLYRPQSESNLTANTDLDALTQNSTILINSVASTVTITVTDAANALPVGTTFEFIWRVGSNDIDFVASGSQVILSADDNLKLRTRYCGAVLTKQLNNTWYLIGDLKA